MQTPRFVRATLLGLAAALTATPRVVEAQQLDKALLLQLVDGQLSTMDSFSCEYEISVAYNKATSDDPRILALEGPASTLYGHLDWLNNGSIHLKSSKSDNLRGSDFLLETSMLDSKMTTFERDTRDAHGRAEIGVAYDVSYGWENTAFDFLPLFHLRNELQRDESVLVDEGLGEAGSRVLRLVYYKNQPADKGRSLRLWISLDEGIRVLKSELYQGIERMCLTEYSMFKEFTAGDAKAWLPTRAEKRSFLSYDRKNGKFLYLTEPAITYKFNLISDKVLIKDARIKKNIAFAIPKGTMVTDSIKKTSYEQGRDLRRAPRTPKEYDRRLLEYVKAAKDSEQEIQATSAARSSTPWMTWASGSAACVLAALLAVVAYNRASSR